jgi:uncharacterized protein YjiK
MRSVRRCGLAVGGWAFAMAGGCSAPQAGLIDGELRLPKVLREVSGVTWVDERTIACVQDEVGSLFFVDLRGERPVREVPFGPPGDYEGLARVGEAYWVLRSDGVLLQLEARGPQLVIAATHRLLLPHQEYEGLCFDPVRRALLVLPKDLVGDGPDGKAQVGVHAFDLATGAFQPEPVLVLQRRVVQEQLERLGVALPVRTTSKGKERPVLKLHCSEIAVLPGSDDLLVLSAVDHLLLRIAPDGSVRGARSLDAAQLPQPEGMTVLADGRLLVASEGGKGRAVAWVVPLP